MMETMPELQEIKSEIGGMEFGAHGGSNSTTPQPHQNFQWVSKNGTRRNLSSVHQTLVELTASSGKTEPGGGGEMMEACGSLFRL